MKIAILGLGGVALLAIMVFGYQYIDNKHEQQIAAMKLEQQQIELERQRLLNKKGQLEKQRAKEKERQEEERRLQQQRAEGQRRQEEQRRLEKQRAEEKMRQEKQRRLEKQRAEEKMRQEKQRRLEQQREREEQLKEGAKNILSSKTRSSIQCNANSRGGSTVHGATVNYVDFDGQYFDFSGSFSASKFLRYSGSFEGRAKVVGNDIIITELYFSNPAESNIRVMGSCLR